MDIKLSFRSPWRQINRPTSYAGPLRSRAAKAIGFIDDMINYSTANAPLPKELIAGQSMKAPSYIRSQ